MDNDRTKRAAKEVKGAIKETAGKLTGNRQTEIEGRPRRPSAGSSAISAKLGDQARDALDKKWRTARPAPRAVPRSRRRALLARADRASPFFRTDRSSPIMKHYRNAALASGFWRGRRAGPGPCARQRHVPDQIDARYDAASNATPAAATPRSLPEAGARRQATWPRRRPRPASRRPRPTTTRPRRARRRLRRGQEGARPCPATPRTPAWPKPRRGK